MNGVQGFSRWGRGKDKVDGSDGVGWSRAAARGVAAVGAGGGSGSGRRRRGGGRGWSGAAWDGAAL
jgi:hypothetical protein